MSRVTLNKPWYDKSILLCIFFWSQIRANEKNRQGFLVYECMYNVGLNGTRSYNIEFTLEERGKKGWATCSTAYIFKPFMCFVRVCVLQILLLLNVLSYANANYRIIFLPCDLWLSMFAPRGEWNQSTSTYFPIPFILYVGTYKILYCCTKSCVYTYNFLYSAVAIYSHTLDTRNTKRRRRRWRLRRQQLRWLQRILRMLYSPRCFIFKHSTLAKLDFSSHIFVILSYQNTVFFFFYSCRFSAELYEIFCEGARTTSNSKSAFNHSAVWTSVKALTIK